MKNNVCLLYILDLYVFEAGGPSQKDPIIIFVLSWQTQFKIL